MRFVHLLATMGLGVALGVGCAEQPGKKADDDKKDAKDGKKDDKKDAKDAKESKVADPK